MLRVVICDDHHEELDKIYKASNNYFAADIKRDIEILTFDNPSICLDELEKIGGCDIALLDICMPGITGISVAKEILALNEKTQVVFITTSDEFAVEAFALGAMHYILKPFTQESFNIGMERIMKKFEVTPTKWFFVNGSGGTVKKINAHDIIFIESFRNGRTLHTAHGTFIETKKTLGGMLDELLALCPKQFVSPYRGYIVNFAAVDSITKSSIVLRNNVTLPIKPDSFRKLRDSYMEYEFGKED